jgi:hypothetical protein
MIKATAYDGRNPQPIVILGLSGENMARLMADEPILIDLADLGLPPQQVALVGGRTEADIAAKLKAHFGTPGDMEAGA